MTSTVVSFKVVDMGMVQEDFSTATWRRFTKSVSKRIDELRELNDSDLDSEKTAVIRGRIAELKRLLDLASASSSNHVLDSFVDDDDQPSHEYE